MKQFKRVTLVAALLIVFVNMGWGQATLPFSYDLGKPTGVTGLTHTGLGTDYSASPKMKFDDTGDNLILNFSGAPGTLSFAIKWNQNISATRFPGNFELLESSNGSTYTRVQLYNSSSGTALPNGTVITETFTTLQSSTRYIKWNYTAKSNGNIGIGAITLSTSSATPSLSITNNGSQPSAGNIGTGTNNNILQSFQITEGDVAAATLTQVTVPLSGSYLTADINGSGLKLYSTTVNTFTSPTLLSSQAGNSTGSGQTVTFGSLTSAISKGGTVYYWVTADISTSATISRTISASALSTSNFTFSSGTITGASVNAGGVQTIISMLPPSAPVAISATNITSNSFTANWNMVADATSYRLDVMTSLGTANNLIQEGFESTTFAPTGWITTGWTRSTAVADIKNGIAATICESHTGTLTTSAVSNPTSLSFYLGRSSNTSAKTLTIEVSTTSQTTGFSTVATFDHSNIPISSYNQYTVDLSSYSSNSTVYVRFNKSSSTTSPWRLDDVLITNYSSPVYVSGYEDKTIIGLSDDVTGLNSGTDYYYRVRAVNSYGTSSNSNLITATTIAGSNISVSPSSLSGFSYVLGSGPSVTQSFDASGSGLIGNITVTGTTDYEVSLTNSSFSNTVTLTQTGGVVTLTPVYVRLKSGLSVGTYNNENVTLTSTGATTKNVSCNGSVVATAQIVYWDAGASTANWNDAANWSNDAVPTTTTEVVLDNTNVSGNYSVNIGATNVAIKKLSIIPTSSNTITLTLTSANTGTPGFQIGDNTNGTDDIIIGNGGLLINQSGAATASPLALIPEADGGTFRIDNGGRYIHKTQRRHADLISSLSVVTGTETGIFEFDVPITTNYFVALNGRTFGTLRFRNSTEYNYSASGVTTGPTIRGNLEFENYNGGTGIFSSSETFTINTAGNIINNGVALIFPIQSFNFNGTAEQVISGTGSITLSNLTLNNSSGLTLNRDVTVNGLLNLTSGKITTGNYFLDFGVLATYPTETSSNYILGNARLNNKTVGTASLNFFGAYIHSGTDDIGNVTITRTTGSAYTFGSNEGINCSWNIVPTTQPVNGRLLDLNWNSIFDNGKNFSASNKAQVWKSTDNGTSWSDIGLLVDVSISNPRSIMNINTTSFSVWSISAQDAPLPVTLSSLNSSITGRNIKLNWTTASEVNNSGFNVERIQSSELGIQNWEKIGFVSGKGTVNTPTNYSFEDRNLQIGKYKYRLKQIDNNGNFEYYALNGEVEIGVPKKFDLSQNYPNPFNPVTKINFDLPTDSKVTMLVYDITGREIARLVNNEFKKAGYYTTDFNSGMISSGVYFYSLSADNFRMTKKMVVLK